MKDTILYVGDLHGNLKATEALDTLATQRDVEAVVQVGDFGLLWGPSLLPFFESRTSTIPWYTAGGNHEHWPSWKALEEPFRQRKPSLVELEAPRSFDHTLVPLAKNVFFVRRGGIAHIAGIRHLFCGGAESGDRHRRTEGVDWWPEETPSREEFEAFAYALDEIHVDVVVTHDAPLEVGTFRHDDRDIQPTCQALTKALELSRRRPPLWFFGHHHTFGTVTIEDPADKRRPFTSPTTSYYACGLEGQGWLLKTTGWGLSGGPSVEQIDACPEATDRRQNRRWV
jgi:hypothetical protein